MHRQKHGPVRPLGAMLCLVAYLFSATPCLPIATAAIAWLDGEHRVVLAVEKDGMSVVLGHDERDARKSLAHSHCLVSRALTTLAKSAGPIHSDHVLSFQSGNTATLREAVARIAAPAANETSAAPPSVTKFVLPVFLTNVEAPLLDIPPPAMSVAVARATVLLI